MRSTSDTAAFDTGSADALGFDLDSNTMDALADVGASPTLPDQDNDGVPDSADIAPDDPELPGTVAVNRVYACTEDELWSLDPKTYALEFESFFDWPADGNIHRMTDLAIDQWGVLYGVSFSTLYTCHPKNGICTQVGELPLALNALTLVPGLELGEDSDVLIGIGGGGEWLRLDLVGTSFSSTELVTTANPIPRAVTRTFCRPRNIRIRNRIGEVDDYIVSGPVDGYNHREVGRVDGFTAIYGLAGWNQRVRIDESGTVSVSIPTPEPSSRRSPVPKKWWALPFRRYYQQAGNPHFLGLLSFAVLQLRRSFIPLLATAHPNIRRDAAANSAVTEDMHGTRPPPARYRTCSNTWVK